MSQKSWNENEILSLPDSPDIHFIKNQHDDDDDDDDNINSNKDKRKVNKEEEEEEEINKIYDPYLNFDTVFQEIELLLSSQTDEYESNILFSSSHSNSSKKGNEEGEEEKKYAYIGIQDLSTSLEEEFIKVESGKSIVYLCCYHINEEGMLPFIQYILQKNKENVFEFPHFTYSTFSSMYKYTSFIIDVISNYYQISSSCVTFQGFQQNENQDLFLFFDMSMMKLNGHLIVPENDIWLVGMDEIVNQQSVFQYPIHEEVVMFFLTHPTFLSLQSKIQPDEYFETPTILYATCDEKLLNFYSVFGISPQSLNANCNGFVFTTKDNILHKNTNTNTNTNTKSNSSNIFIDKGMVRLAVFLGSMFVPDLERNESNSVLDTFTWQDYNSVYLNEKKNNETDSISGNNEKIYTTWWIREYKQQIVLSCHHLFTSKHERNNLECNI